MDLTAEAKKLLAIAYSMDLEALERQQGHMKPYQRMVDEIGGRLKDFVENALKEAREGKQHGERDNS